MPLTLRTSLEGIDPADAVYIPGLRGLEGPHLDLLATLPISDVNGTLMAALDDPLPWLKDAEAPVVGLFLADPFLRLAEVAAQLKRAGVRRVANYPTLQAFEGETARALASVGFALEAELDGLRMLAAGGFEVVGFASSSATARQLGTFATTVVLHPGPGADSRHRDVLAAMAAWLGPELAVRRVTVLLLDPHRGAAFPP
jgi:predicted TIM-barrel enzyme